MQEIRLIKKTGVPLCPSCGRPPCTTYVGMYVIVDCDYCKIGTSCCDSRQEAEAEWLSAVQEWHLHYQFENGCYCESEAMA